LRSALSILSYCHSHFLDANTHRPFMKQSLRSCHSFTFQRGKVSHSPHCRFAEAKSIDERSVVVPGGAGE
jgi:hypothetical protein